MAGRCSSVVVGTVVATGCLWDSIMHNLATHRGIIGLVPFGLMFMLSGLDAHAQEFFSQANGELVGEGWNAFTDFEFLLRGVLTLSLATLLGAVIAYHPRSKRSIDTVEEAEAPKIYLTYSVIGAIIGIMVLKFGVVVGFVVFGIGGLIRFRTDLGSATKTGRLIFVTLIGLSTGLDLPHLAVLATAFGFGLIFFLDSRTTFRIEVKNLHSDKLADAAGVYAGTLEENGCKILSTKRSFSKEEVTIVFQAPRRLSREAIERVFESSVPRSMHGVVDWQIS